MAARRAKEIRKVEKQKAKKSKLNERRKFNIRGAVLASLFVVVAIFLGVKMGEIQLIKAEEWRAKASESQLQSETIAPSRGSIYDANMYELAHSSLVWKLAVDPNTISLSYLTNVEDKSIEPARFAANKLAEILGMDAEVLYEKCVNKSTSYIVLAENIEKPQVDKIRELINGNNLRGILLEEESVRRYMYGDLLAPVLGFTYANGSGAAGLEYQYNETLLGTPGRSISVRDKKNQEIAIGEESLYYAPQDGYSLQLTIDIQIQQSLEKNLASAVAKYVVAERGMGVVMDINTGAVLAMATFPSFDPNNPYQVYETERRAEIEAMLDEEERNAALYAALNRQWRNKTVSDTYEPGSVFKVITAAAAVDSGKFSMDSIAVCNGVYHVLDHEIRCAQDKTHGALNIHDALLKSCNICFVQYGQGVGAPTLLDYINAFGLTRPTGIDLPGEITQAEINNLVYTDLDRIGESELASISFGQSNNYTPLQMLVAASAAVNGGNLVQPHVVSRLLDSEGRVVKEINPQVKRQVISEETSAQLAQALEDLVTVGEYGKNAYVAGYHVGGKSGTSEKLKVLADTEESKYLSSFFAFAPANNPQIAVIIILDEPTHDPVMGNFFGGRLAGPAVGGVISDTVKILGIDPDYNEEELARTTINTPNLVEMDLEAALVVLNQQGLSYRVVGSGSEVVAQYPESYMQVPRGGQIIVYTEAVEMQMETMPLLLDLSAKEAIEMLKSMGLNVFATGASEQSTYATVVEQDIAPGTVIPKGTVITLVIEDYTQVGD